MELQIVALVILLFLSGFFSSSETALFSISNARAKHIGKGDSKTDKLIKKMKDDSHKLLTTILIGNNLVNIGASAIATSLAIRIFDNNGVGIATGVMTLFILIFGEILPKSIASKNNLLVARIVIYPIYFLSILFFPVIILLNFIPKITGKIKKAPTATEEELMTIVEAVEEEGEIKQKERELIHNIFKLDDVSASEIMTPSMDVFTVDIAKPLPIHNIIESGYSRIPVIKENIDNVVGLLNIRDIFKAQIVQENDINIKKIMTTPFFIPETKKINELLAQFQKSKNHIVVTVNEHGENSGIVTLEDVLEVLVGEIEDESDNESPDIIKIKKHHWIVYGKADIEDVNNKIKMNVPGSYEYDTFSGFILWKLGRIPSAGEKIAFENYEILVKEKDKNRINILNVTKLEGE